MSAGELCQLGDAIELLGRIDVRVEDPYATHGASRRADHCVWPLSPPCADLRLISGRVFEAVRCERLFIERVARENREALAHVVERSVELVERRVGLWLRAPVILPPSLKNRLCRY